MTPSAWLQIKNFKPYEFSDPEKMDLGLVTMLDAWRTYMARRVIITCSTTGVHVEDSQHYTGNAVDLIVIDRNDFTLLDCFTSAIRFGFTGIGVYPDWRYTNSRGQVVVGGMHLDNRPLSLQEPRKLWLGVKQIPPAADNPTGNLYLPLTQANLETYKGI